MIELGGGVEAQVEQGHVRFTAGSAGEPAEAELTVPGVCRFGSWEVRADLQAGVPRAESPDLAVLDPAALGADAHRALAGGRATACARSVSVERKSLQDLFTDRKVPRSLRHALPVVTSDGRIAWIAGVAVSEEFAARPGVTETAVLQRGAESLHRLGP